MVRTIKMILYIIKKMQSDMDECQTNNGGCDQTCTNTPGSFGCSCTTGYTLAPDDSSCEGIPITLTGRILKLVTHFHTLCKLH